MAIPTNIKTLLSGEVVEWARIEFKETWDPATSLKSVCAFAKVEILDLRKFLMLWKQMVLQSQNLRRMKIEVIL